MKKITVIGGFTLNDSQKNRLESLGEVSFITSPKSSEEWLSLVSGADVILSNGDYLLENLYNLKNVFITYPYIEIGNFDSKKLEANNVLIANTRGSNRNSIVEWVMFSTLALFRNFLPAVNAKEDVPFALTQSLEGKKVLIVGKGNIGTQVGSLCEAFGMKVDFFYKGDNLKNKSADADLIVNCLNCNPTSENLLNEEFFMSLKPGSRFVSFVRQYTYDLGALLKSLDNNILGGVAIDCDPEIPGDTKNDFYQKLFKHEKVLVTPHIAFSTQQAKINGIETAIQNIESYMSGNPQNILKK